MDDAPENVEHPEQAAGDDLVAELRELLGSVPPQVVERADDARRSG
ncbi:hypothetical protein [Jiangella aurantiaca]|nr:hypothetical protein [Jiangella aurantiaca]